MFKINFSLVLGILSISSLVKADIYRCFTQCEYATSPIYEVAYHLQSDEKTTVTYLHLMCDGEQYNVNIVSDAPHQDHPGSTDLTALDSATNSEVASIILSRLGSDPQTSYILRWRGKNPSDKKMRTLWCRWNGK